MAVFAIVVLRVTRPKLRTGVGAWLAGAYLLATFASLAMVGAAAGCGTILGFEEPSALDPLDEAGASAATPVDAGSSEASVFGSNVQSLTGDVPAARFSPVVIDFGAIDCAGDSPDPLALTISNVGDAALTWSASLSEQDGGPFHILGDTTGTVAPNDEIALAISTDPLDDSVSVGEMDIATLMVTTNDPGGATQPILVQRTISGAQLVANTTALQFADGAPDSGVQMMGFTVTNTGNRRVTVKGMVNADPAFGVTWPGSPSVVDFDGADLLAYTVSYDPAHTLGTPNAITFDVEGPLCGDPPVVVVIPGNVRQ